MRSLCFAPLALLGVLLYLAGLSQAQNTNGISNSTAASVFVSPAVDIAFALNVPEDSDTELYFSLLMPIRITWGAIGLGSYKMAGSLILMAYSSSSGKNVTLSPRIASGHSEPVYTPDFQIEALAGTGLVNETTYVFNGKCSNCRAWNSGSLDVGSKAQSFLYATGPDGDIDSDDVKAPLKMHWNYGTFTMDMVHATGEGAVPIIDPAKEVGSIATTQGLSVFSKSDTKAMAHAIILVFCFVGLFPFGILVLRLGSFVRWHVVNQGLALVLFVVGAALGTSVSFTYNRSKNFRNQHQVLGLIVFVFVIAQFVLGFLHHRIFKKTLQPTKLAPVHTWLGRLTIVLGVINAFLGFPFAQSSNRNYILAALVLFVFPVLFILLVTKNFIKKRWNRAKETVGNEGGYDMEPWRQAETQAGYEHRTTVTAGHQDERPPDVGLFGVQRGAEYPGGRQPNPSRADWGPPQSAREYV